MLDDKVALYRHIPDQQRLSFKITPIEGQLLRADFIGAQIKNLARLYRVAGDDENKWQTFLTGLSMDDDGSVTVEVSLLPLDEGGE